MASPICNCDNDRPEGMVRVAVFVAHWRGADGAARPAVWSGVVAESDEDGTPLPGA
jgi:hypothetical protein